MAAVGPDFRAGFVDPAPVSNADLAVTLEQILRLRVTPKGPLAGRVLSEALLRGAPVATGRRTIRSNPAANGFTTVLNLQTAGRELYFDAAGAPGERWS